MPDWSIPSRSSTESNSAVAVSTVLPSCSSNDADWTETWPGTPARSTVRTATFEEQDGKTVLTATALFDSVEDRDGMLQSGMEEGAVETYERLDEYLEVLAAKA